MMVNEPRGDIPHNLVLEDRRRLSVSGVTEVISFDDCQVVMETDRGLLTVEGADLHVEKLSLDVGELTLEGEIDSLSYAREGKGKGGFWSRVF
ncbi:MAG: sporulation protein YabP [Clostridiaceae bacterium]|nr:sporulation protein YabP [Clostridiaceae bacterium]